MHRLYHIFGQGTYSPNDYYKTDPDPQCISSQAQVSSILDLSGTCQEFLSIKKSQNSS